MYICISYLYIIYKKENFSMTTETTTTIKMPKETLIKIKSLAVKKGTSPEKYNKRTFK